MPICGEVWLLLASSCKMLRRCNILNANIRLCFYLFNRESNKKMSAIFISSFNKTLFIRSETLTAAPNDNRVTSYQDALKNIQSDIKDKYVAYCKMDNVDSILDKDFRCSGIDEFISLASATQGIKGLE